ncbi:SMC family ATPase [Georgenia sunbinii]|uniref:SMC family ATPase n=1 Tax=Georgenia sunbinii TaxID=3117728 RepID=UPI002F26B5AD
MRIHRLGIEAIGPFPDRHDVDLDELSAGGLFLLEGPTGAGKSTLIDAITYGLYGTLGSPQVDERLPSAHAPDREPVIEVVFSTGAGIFRVRRTPPYDRPKRRGEGTTRQNATARLWRLADLDDAAGEPLSGGAQEVGTEVRQILGIDRVQFSQTVVLPQGRFATFLRAKPEERAQVLQDVFGTAVYQRLQAQLAEMARAAKGTLESARQDITSAVATFRGLLAEDDDAVAGLTEAAQALDHETLEQVTANIVTGLGTASTAAEAAQLRAATAERDAQHAWDAQRELDQLLVRRRALLVRQAELAEREPAVSAQRARLAAGRRAAGAAGSLRSHVATTGTATSTEETLARLCAEIEDGPDADLAGTDLGALTTLATELTGEKGALSDPLRLEAGLAARAAALAADEAAVAADRVALTGQDEAIAARPAQREVLEAALAELRRTSTPVAAAELLAAERRKVLEAARRAEAHAAELATAEHDVAQAQLAVTGAWAHEQAVRRRWINGMAGNLAAELTADEPCPVCGSTEHPDPTTESPDHAAIEDVEAATGARQRADTRLVEADGARIRAAERLTAQRQAAGHVTLPDAEATVAAADADVTAARETATRLTRDEAALTAFDAETAALKEQRALAEQAVATAAERLRGATEQLDADRGRCREAAGGAESVAARVTRLEARVAVVDALAGARRHHDDAVRRLTEATAALDEALAEAGFADAASARAAQLAASELAALESELEAYDAEVAGVRSGLADAALAALTGDEVADVAAAQQRHAEHRSALAAANRTAATAATSLDRCERARQALLAVLTQHRQAAAAAAPVLRMAELATGGEGNTRATTLATFVLLRRFEDVVAAANDRLAVISGGRFALLRKDSREGRARRTGLGLEVRDHRTETNRDPHTLSGGETFYVSLCLALGLADVVTSEAGGITLDTLFIDEGFGSLDPHTLDGVLGELSRLQAGGRSVGIVSHVSELKDRIAERIEVSRLPSGASTLTVRA